MWTLGSSLLGRLVGTVVPSLSGLSLWQEDVSRILAREDEYAQLSDEELRRESAALRYRAQSGEPLSRLVVEGFSLVREAAARGVGFRHYPVQLLGGCAMHAGCIAEMQTGEGKTLTATLPLFLAALEGKGAQLATANDYLAKRDANWARPIYQRLGLSVAVIDGQSTRAQRRDAYLADITYGTAKEFGFDFLRDCLFEDQGDSEGTMARLLVHDGRPGYRDAVQRRHFILVDEADSIMIDEARTPLIVSTAPSDDRTAMTLLYRWACDTAKQLLETKHYTYDFKTKKVSLTTEGKRLLRELPRAAELQTFSLLELYERAECAIKVDRDYLRDKQYVVSDGEVVIVDENTGRLAEGRKWREGIHQAIEAKEGLKIGFDSGEAARVTLQTFLRSYPRLAGMTGTAMTSRRELHSIYQKRVVKIPTHKPAIRQQLPTRVFGTEAAKWEAIAEESLAMHQQGRSVLIGTRTIGKSQQLSQLLTQRQLPHAVLNARQLEQEAAIVASAGESGRIVVATNMAGRGTDILLSDEVRSLGGLHVIATEMHESPRIDRQLIGRCGRQGDPGSYRQYLSLEDEILAVGLGPTKSAVLRTHGSHQPGEVAGMLHHFVRAQNIVERKHYDDRCRLMRIEKEKRKLQLQLGQNPYLDAAE